MAQHFHRLNVLLFSCTLFFTLCGLFLVPQGNHYLSKLLVLSSVVGFINYFIGNKDKLGVSARNLYVCVLIYIAAIGASRLVHDDESWLIRNLFYILVFFLLIPREAIVIRAFKLGALLGGISIGLLAIWQHHNGMFRVEGFTNAILFAQGALILVVLNGFLGQVESNKFVKCGYFIGAGAAVIAIYLSQSRGVWLALLMLTMLALSIKAIKKPVKYIALFIMVFILLTIVFSETEIFKIRIQESLSELSMMESNNYNTSWGLRVMAWKSAWFGFIEHPVLGIGLDGFKNIQHQQLLDGIVDNFYVNYGMYHAHNQFMQNMVVRGIFGLLGAIAVLVYPMIFFYHRTKVLSAGFMVSFGIFVCALSDVPMEHQNTLYIYMITLFSLCLSYEIEKNKEAMS